MEIPATFQVSPQNGTVIFDFENGTVSRVENGVQKDVLVAAAAPVKPPLAWLERPEADVPTPMTYQDNGEVFGHLALWNSCHRGFMGGAFTECVKPPPSKNNYQQFELGTIETKEGTSVPVGKITFDGNHAPLTEGAVAASQHYDNTATVGAYVRARNGKLGIWLSGAQRSDLTPAQVQSLRANPLSGDWRSLNHNLELVASLAVPIPGFAIPQSQLALAASSDGGLEVCALILPALTAEDLEEEEALVASYSRAQILKKKMLKQSRSQMTAAVLTTEARKALPKSSFAIPGSRSYPIHDEAHARNALARSAGKPEAARVRAAVCKRYPDMGECGGG